MKLLFFRADWCNPCRQMEPIVSSIMDEDYFKDRYSGIEHIDVDSNWQTASRWGISGVPTFVIVDDQGKEVARKLGAMPGRRMREWLEEGPTSWVLATTDPILDCMMCKLPDRSNKENTMLKAIKKMLGLTQDSPVIGSIELWAGYSSRVPELYARCEGQRMSIRDNPALFSLIGITYGGDGRDYFNLPDYRPRDNKGNPQPWDPAKSPVVLICIQGMYPQMD